MPGFLSLQTQRSKNKSINGSVRHNVLSWQGVVNKRCDALKIEDIGFVLARFLNQPHPHASTSTTLGTLPILIEVPNFWWAIEISEPLQRPPSLRLLRLQGSMGGKVGRASTISMLDVLESLPTKSVCVFLTKHTHRKKNPSQQI